MISNGITLDKTYWEKVAESKWGKYTSDFERDAVLKAHNLFNTPLSALDIGAEGGKWSMLLSETGWKMTCTDISSESIDICKQRLPNAKCILVNKDDETLPVGLSSQSIVLCIEVAPVIQSNWFIQEISRSLKPGGVIIGIWWNKLSIRGFFAHFTAKYRKEFDYYKKSYFGFRKELKSSGFNIVHEIGYCWFPFSRNSNHFLVPIFIRLEKWIGLQKLPGLSPWVIFIARKRHK